jgi:hypothetical protein
MVAERLEWQFVMIIFMGFTINYMKWIACAVIGLLIGSCVGWFSNVLVRKHDTQGAIVERTTQMGQLVITLRMLRSGESALGIESLEGMLDSDLINLAALEREGRVDVSKYKHLQIVRQYRSDFPRSADPAVQTLENEVFRQLSAGSEKRPVE